MKHGWCSWKKLNRQQKRGGDAVNFVYTVQVVRCRAAFSSTQWQLSDNIGYLPHCDNPDKIVATALLSMPSPQFVTMQSSAIAFAKSFVVSVFPVPAGPEWNEQRFSPWIDNFDWKSLYSRQCYTLKLTSGCAAQSHQQSLCNCEVDAIRQWCDDESTVQPHVLVAVFELAWKMFDYF